MFSADETAQTGEEVKKRWDEIKAEERKEKGRAAGPAAGVPRALPALVEAQQITHARRAPVSTGATPKKCSRSWMKSGRSSPKRANADRRIRSKMSWAICCSCWSIWPASSKWIPEQALRRTNAKFRAAVRPCGAAPRGAGQSGQRHADIEELEALWQEAKQTKSRIRELNSERQQFREAVALQKTIWGFERCELLPLRLFVVATKIGGQVFGAYDDGRMVAFCLAIPGLKPDGKIYLHSHMLGVLPGYRNAGIGRQLKLRQRDDALARGIDLIEWTFDPLDIKNAYFNIERLGAIVRRYVRNQYGESPACCTAACRPIDAWRSGGSGSARRRGRVSRWWSGFAVRQVAIFGKTRAKQAR